MDKASELFSAKHCAVFYVDHVFNKLVYACSMGYNQEVLMGFGLTADEESGIPGWCAKHGKFLSLKDVQKDPHMIDIERQNKFPVLFCQPIVQRDKPIAVICVGEVRRELEEKELLRSASLLANLSSIAIENARLMERTKEQAIRDGLTGLYNHRHFYEILELIMKKMVEKEGSALGILLIDIDHFKEFNDTHGHLVGDSILQETAGILKKQTQKDDMAARYGGEEFAIICIRKDTAGIKAVAEDLRRSVERAAFRNGQLELKLTISVGVAFYNVKERPGLPASELVRRADEVLYKAKESGRNKVCVYE
jgi:diguanylate cyclase (GGDEF)-like protein